MPFIAEREMSRMITWKLWMLRSRIKLMTKRYWIWTVLWGCLHNWVGKIGLKIVWKCQCKSRANYTFDHVKNFRRFWSYLSNIVIQYSTLCLWYLACQDGTFENGNSGVTWTRYEELFLNWCIPQRGKSLRFKLFNDFFRINVYTKSFYMKVYKSFENIYIVL